MKLSLAAAAGAALLAMASGALAAEPIVAKLQTSAPGAAKPVAGGAVFECLGDMCASRTPSADTNTVRGCKELARQVGAVSSFGPSSKQMSADQLSSCNESAHK